VENKNIKALLPSLLGIALLAALYYSYFNASIFPYIDQWRSAKNNHLQLTKKIAEMTDYIQKNPTSNITVEQDSYYILPAGRDKGIYAQNLIIPRESPIKFPDIRVSESPSLTITERQYHGKAPFSKVSLHYQAIGRFQDIGNYLLDLESRKMMYTIEEMTLKPLSKSGGRIDLHSKLSIYFVN